LVRFSVIYVFYYVHIESAQVFFKRNAFKKVLRDETVPSDWRVQYSNQDKDV